MLLPLQQLLLQLARACWELTFSMTIHLSSWNPAHEIFFLKKKMKTRSSYRGYKKFDLYEKTFDCIFRTSCTTIRREKLELNVYWVFDIKSTCCLFCDFVEKHLFDLMHRVFVSFRYINTEKSFETSMELLMGN